MRRPRPAMSISSPLPSPCLRAVCAVFCFLLGGWYPLEAIEINHTLTQRIWKEKFGVTDAQFYSGGAPANGLNPSWMAGDDDVDGVNNGGELAAGTNPFDAVENIAVTQVVKNGDSAEVQFPTKAGKRYRVETTTDLSNSNSWVMQPQPAPLQITGNGGAMVLSVPYVANTFYRVRVDDIDEDNDGVGSWVEDVASTNPYAAATEGGLDDHTFMVQQLDDPNVVTITASKPFASEDGPDSGMFTITRSRRIFPQSLSLAYTGTALPADYTAGTTVDFGAKTASVNVMVNPVTDSMVEGSKSVVATVEEDPDYVVGANGSATVIIKDSTAQSGTGLRGQYYDTASSTYSNSANFNPAQLKVTRVDPVVDNDWAYGTPNNVSVTPGNPVDNYSTVFEGYLNPTTAGDYQFQLDGDDKARVLLDLDNNGTFELPGEQIVEHGWDTAATGSPEDGVADDETIGTFKASAAHTLAVPGTPAQRYKIRVEHVETTGDARCRLQWRRGTAAYADIPTANVLSHTRALTNYTVAAGVATINTAVNHGLSVSDPVTLYFSSGTLFTPPANFSGNYTVASVVDLNTFTISVPGASNQTSGAAGFMADSTSTTRGYLDRVYTNTTFTAPAGRVGELTGGPTNANGGIWGSGTPSPTPGATFIERETFSIRWTGQVQPQFSEEYTFAVHADDGCRLWINDQELDLKMSANGTTGGTYTYDSGTGNFVVNYANSVIPADTFAVNDVVRIDPSSGNLTHATGSTYSYDTVTGDAVITYSNLTNVTASGFKVGQTVELDPTSGPVGLGLLPYEIKSATATTFTVSFGAGLYLTGAGNINVSDNLDRTITAVTSTTFTVNLGTAKYADNSTGNVNIFALNLPLKPWASNGNERYARVPVIAGVRYNIKLEYYENTSYARCRLYWFSPSQPKQIIPTNRLYPESGPLAPAAHITSTDATALVGGAFSIPINGSNGGVVTVSGNPAWLTHAGGILSGTPPNGSAGDYQILITITNAAGTSTSVLNLHVEENAGTVVRESWTGVAGITLADIPTGNAPNATANLSSLEATPDLGDNYGERIRGYITAPETGNYYFWIAAKNAAELWISNDDEPVTAFKRAWVTTGSATPQIWNGETNQKSPWLALEQGRKYYFEILHNAAGVGQADNLAVGWAKPGQATTVPSEVVPGYALSPYIEPAAGSTPGTLYVATMLAQGLAATNGVGTSTLQLSEDETQAYMRYSYNNLTGPIVSQHIHTDPYNGKPSTIVFDIDTPENPGDGLITNPQDPNVGAYLWTISPIGTLSAAEIIEIIKAGRCYINLHTAMYPNGEIRGNYTLANGSRTFTPPAAPPPWTDDHADANAAARFLTQATFGPNPADITALQGMASYEAWIDDQFLKSSSPHLDEVLRAEQSSAQGAAFDESLSFNTWWWKSISGDDQLRQRIAFALSEIHVVSGQGPLDNNARAISYFYDKLVVNAFGNFRDILEDTTLTPSMGRYLDMLRNDKPDPTIGRIPNENYAREIKQLFSIGLYSMWPDGTFKLTSKDSLVDTYTQTEIVGLSHVFTGWDYGYDGPDRTSLNAPADWTRQMRATPARHFTGQKRLINNEVLPGLTSVGGNPLDPLAVHNSTSYYDPDYVDLPDLELEAAHDLLFNHPNVGPFICRQLIQRLVTSHPSRGYLYRVVQAFDNNGSGVRGDMKAVIKAIFLDYEARSADMLNVPAYGKQREPVLRVAAAARAFRRPGWTGTYNQNGSRTITITTSTPHGLQGSGLAEFMEFTTGSPAPATGAYTVTRVNDTTLTTNATGWATGTYTIAGTTCTVTMNNHWLQVGHQIYVDFTSGTGVDGVYGPLETASAQTGTGAGSNFTFTVPEGATSGNCMIPRFNPGSYTSASSGLPAPNDRRVTMDTTASFGNNGTVNHELQVGDQVQINFTGGNPQPVDMVVTVESVIDNNTWTFLAPSAGTNLGTNQGNNSVYQFPLQSRPLVRNGAVTSRPSTFNVGNTDLTLNQSPINSPTVFNFFLPDYKYPGTLASQGITTPEFQETAETTVIRQANYLTDGLLNPSQDFTSSFATGNNALVMNFASWMPDDATDANGLGAPANETLPWTHNENIDLLIDKMSTLLMAGQLSTNAKAVIRNFVARPIASIAATSPCTVTTVTAHGYNTGDSVVISGATGGTYSTGTFNSNTTARIITVTGANTFTVNGVNCTVAPTSVANAHVSPIAYNQGSTSPSNANRRDRIRSILHLILTSPDFTIQR